MEYAKNIQRRAGRQLAVRWRRWLPWIYVPLINLVELLVVTGDMLASMGAQVAVFTLLALHRSFLSRDQSEAKLLLGLSLLPLMRMISFSMPLQWFARDNWLLVVAIPMLVSTFIVWRINFADAPKLGRPRIHWGAIALQGCLALGGCALGWLMANLMQLEPWDSKLLAWNPSATRWLPLGLTLVVTAFTEEFLFRGVLQPAATEVYGWPGLILVALLSMVVSVGATNEHLRALQYIGVFIFALLCGCVAHWTRTWIGLVLMRAVMNITAYILIPQFEAYPGGALRTGLPLFTLIGAIAGAIGLAIIAQRVSRPAKPS